MKAQGLAIQRFLEEFLDDDYSIRIIVKENGNLPNRVPFIRTSYRQTTIDSWLDEETDFPDTVGPLDILYTIHARYLMDNEIVNTMEKLKQDLDDFLRAFR